MKLFSLWIVLLTITVIQNGYADSKYESDLEKWVLSNKANINNNSLVIINNSDSIRNNKNKVFKNKEGIITLNSDVADLHEAHSVMHSELEKNNKQIEKNTNSLQIQKQSINSYQQFLSTRTHEQEKYQLEIDGLKKTLEKLNTVSGLSSDYLDRFWVLIAAVLVFFMQAGFKAFKSGMVRMEHEDNVAIKNVLDWLIISLVYFVVGFGVMYGDSYRGLIGTNLFSPTYDSMNEIKNSITGQHLGLEFFLYQLAFAATAATIVSGAMSERTALIPYIFLSVFIGIFIYPVFGHWAWGGTYFQTDQGWLYRIGFRDFAGSTVVHSVGAWVALAGIIEIGARHGRYDAQGNLNKKDFRPTNLGYSTLGVFILWFGWWGFNGGSQLKYDHHIASIILNTTLAGATAGLTAFFHGLSQSRDKYEVFPKLLGGILGGLVAITACCNIVSSWEAMLIGGIAGLVHNFSYDYLMLKLKLDDPVGAIAIHGFCGVWGTLCVALFGNMDSGFILQNSAHIFAENSFPFFLGGENTRLEQILIQIAGVTVAFLYTFTTSRIFFKLIRIIPGIGLRVTPEDEKKGSLLGFTY